MRALASRLPQYADAESDSPASDPSSQRAPPAAATTYFLPYGLDSGWVKKVQGAGDWECEHAERPFTWAAPELHTTRPGRIFRWTVCTIPRITKVPDIVILQLGAAGP